MPYRASRQCNYPGCKVLSQYTYCPIHRKEIIKQRETSRSSANARGYGRQWQLNSKLFLKDNPLCDICYKAKRLTPATLVHHIKDHKGNYDLFWDISNWQPLCRTCHDKITRPKTIANMKEA